MCKNHKADLNPPSIHHISPFLNHEDNRCNRIPGGCGGSYKSRLIVELIPK